MSLLIAFAVIDLMRCILIRGLGLDDWVPSSLYAMPETTPRPKLLIHSALHRHLAPFLEDVLKTFSGRLMSGTDQANIIGDVSGIN